MMMPVPTPWGDDLPGASSGGAGDADDAKVRHLLVELHAVLARNAVGVGGGGGGGAAPAARSRNEAWGTAGEPRADSPTELLRGVTRAFHASKYGLRTGDDEGDRLAAFNLLAKPGSHEVTYRRATADVSFRDEPSPSERLGMMRFAGNFCLAMYILFFTVGNLMLLTVMPSSLLVIAGVWTPGETPEKVLMGLWIAYYVLNAIWLLCYMLSYTHPSALRVRLKAGGEQIVWLLLTRLCYTITCAIFSHTGWNVAALTQTLVHVASHLLWDPTMVFFRLRMSRATYDEFFSPKAGLQALLQNFHTSVPTLIDVGRHLAVLHAVELQLEAEGRLGEEAESLAQMTVVGRAFHITLRELMNGCFTASIIFQAHLALERLGGIGMKVTGMPDTWMVNTK